MEKVRNAKEHNKLALKLEIFNNYFSQGKIQPISISEIPESALEKFETYSHAGIKIEDYKPKNFDSVYKITHENGDHTYVAKQTKNYTVRGKNSTEELTYLFDINSQNQSIGYGEIRKPIGTDLNPLDTNAFVGYTKTYDEFQNSGYGTKRLLIMNAISQMLYLQPLHSDTIIEKGNPGPETHIWEKLVKQNAAISYNENGDKRYRFI